MRQLFYVFFYLSTGVFAQQQRQVDSLKLIIQEDKLHDSIISNGYVSLIRHYKRNNEDSCLIYFKRFKEYADKNNSNLANHYYYQFKAGYYGLFLKEDEDSFELIITNREKALEYAEASKKPTIILKSYSKLSEAFYGAGNVEKALDYSRKQEAYANERGLWLDVAYAYSKMGEIYLEGYGMTETSLKFLLKSDSIYRLYEDQNEDRAFTKSSIGDVYKQLGDIAEAESYQKEAMLLFEENNNVYQQIYILGKLASIEREKKNYPQAIIYFADCINYYQENKYPVREAMYHIGLSDVYFENNQIEKAIETAQTAVTLSTNLSNDFGILLGLINKSRFLYAAKNYQESYKLAIEAKAIADEMDSYIDKKDALDLLYKSSEKLGRFEEAYNFSKEHKRVSDTLANRQNLQQTKTLEAQYKNSQQEQEIALLHSQNQLTIVQKKNQKNLLFGIVGFASIALMVLYYLYRNRQKTATKLLELSAAKSTFFQNISHEFRTPLSLISGPIERRLENKNIDEGDRKEFEMIHRNSNRLMDLINQILDISKIESKEINVRVSKGNLNSHLKSLAASFNYKAKEKQIDFNVIVDGMDDSWFDKDAIEKITINLLSNAFKFAPEKGLVTLNARQENGMALIEFENSGSHFTKTEMNTIFDRFSRLDSENEEVGTGIGLALVKELTQLSRGEIKVENSKNDAVKFSVMLPIERIAYKPHEIVTSKPSIDIVNQNSENNSSEVDDSPLMLVVDDNDDIRTFINESFNNEYRIIEAIDGQKGIDAALEFIPDIVISDIMMPNVSGIELCSQLKQDQRTSHIPIVLLTAKVDKESQYQGLETGADDYVLKPFSVKLLATRVNNLVKSRLQLQDRYSKEVILKPRDIAINTIDEGFLEKVQEVLDENMADDSFSVKDFCDKISMSRMQLHRKLKALTGLSASEFLRTERLKLAVSLFKDASLNINEICYQSGFNSPSYFSKCFKETFGILPSEYRDLN